MANIDLWDPGLSGLTGTALTKALIRAMEEQRSMALHYAPEYIGYIPENRRAELLIRAMEGDPYAALQYAPEYISYIPQNRRAELLTRAMEEDPSATLTYTEEYIQHIPKNRRAELLVHAMEEDPHAALASAKKYIDHIPESQRAKLLVDAMAEDPFVALAGAPYYIEHIPENWRTEPLIRAMGEDPQTALVSARFYIYDIPQNRRAEPLIRAMGEKPYIALEYVGDYIDHIPENRRAEPLEKAAQQLIEDIDYTRIRDAVFPHLSPKTIRMLEGIRDQRNEFLEYGSYLNYNHARPDAERFAGIEGSSAAYMYTLMVFGREELYTSSYIGVFDRFVRQMKQEGHRSIFDVADPTYKTSPVIFLESAATYGKLEQAIGLIPREKWRDVLGLFSTKIEHSDASAAASLAEIMQKMPDPAVKAQMEAFLQSKYNNSQPGRVQDIYGVAAAYYNQLSGRNIVTLQNPERYRLEPMKTLSPQQVFGTDDVHRQLMVFTDDEDGQSSFDHFRQRYKNNSAYTIEDNGKYLKISSRGEKNKIEIYANHPDESPDVIIGALAGHKEARVDEVEFDAVIHRGHSYNLRHTMPYLSAHNRFVYVGSCGGFKNVESILNVAPDAQIASTKQTGTKFVNDPMLYHINESIRRDGTVNWQNEQIFLESLDSDGKNNAYVLPHKNVALAITRRLNTLPKRDGTAPVAITTLTGDKGEDDNFVFINEAGKTDHLGPRTITNFETSMVWGLAEDKITVGRDVGGARMYTNNGNPVIFFEGTNSEIIPGTSVTLENFGDGLITSRLDDVDIWLEETKQPLPSDKIKRVEGSPPSQNNGPPPRRHGR